MDTNEALRQVISSSGLSMRSISESLGKSPTWLGSTLGRDGSSRAATVADVASVCGWSLALVQAGEEPRGALVIDGDIRPAADRRQALERRASKLTAELEQTRQELDALG